MAYIDNNVVYGLMDTGTPDWENLSEENKEKCVEASGNVRILDTYNPAAKTFTHKFDATKTSKEDLKKHRHNFLLQQLFKQVSGEIGKVDTESYTMASDLFSDEKVDNSMFRKNRRYRKDDRVVYIQDDFLDWINCYYSGSIRIEDSKLLISDRYYEWSGLEMPYAQLNMRPGHKYRLSVKYFPTGEQYIDKQALKFDKGLIPEEDLKLYRGNYPDPSNPERVYWMRLYILASKMKHPGVEGYLNRYNEVFSSGKTPPGEFEKVVLDLDFSSLKNEIPGDLRIQTVATGGKSNHHYDFYLDDIKVVDRDSGETVYFNDFNDYKYTAVQDIPQADASPDNSPEWTTDGEV
jgi:hypothetical protein